MQCVVHDPARVPDPKNCAFFPKRKQGQVAPIQPRKMARKSCYASKWHFSVLQAYALDDDTSKLD
jgi:hypothetical protein